MLDVHTLRTTAYHPQADGITERFNRTIKDMLAQFVDQDAQNDWDLKLEKLSFAYNTAVHATTKCSPFELMFGRIPKLPIDLVYDQTNETDMRAKYEVEWIASEFVDQQRREMRAMFDFAAANRDAAALKASALYDRTIRGIDFKIGDRVWLLDQSTKVGVNPKLRPRWKGPYTVANLFNEVNAILKADGRSKKLKVIHFSKLKKCFGKPPIIPISNRDHSVEETSLINEFQERVAPAPESQSEQNRMACAREHQPLGQVRGDRDEHCEFTVNRELSKGHGSSDKGMKTRATTAKQTTRTSKEQITKKSNKLPATNLSRVEEELNEWENEEMPALMDTNEYQDECVSKKTPKVPLICGNAGWLGNKQTKGKTNEDTDEESNGSG